MHTPTIVMNGARRPEMGETPIVTVTDLTVAFTVPTPLRLRLRGAQFRLHAVRDVNLTLRRGSSLSIVGESGSGKTTLAKAMLGLVAPTTGSVQIDSAATSHGPPPLQMVFQDPTSSLDPRQTVGDAIAEMLRAHRLVARSLVSARCDELLELVGLPQRVRTALPRQLSGGQRQRVAIARALALDPVVLVADEAVASLDVSVKAGILNLLRDLQRRLGLTLVLITHDLATVRHVTDEVAVMYLGRIVEQGPVDEVMTDPRHPYTQALLSAVPRLNVAETGAPTSNLAGEPPSPLAPPTGCAFHTRCPFVQETCVTQQPALLEISHGHHVACPIRATRTS